MEANRHGEDQEVRGGTCPVYGLEFRLRRAGWTVLEGRLANCLQSGKQYELDSTRTPP